MTPELPNGAHTTGGTVLVGSVLVVLAVLVVAAGLVVVMAVPAWRRHQAGAQVVEVLAPPRLDYPTALAAAAIRADYPLP